MQKLLFATTALVATAGMAAADVTFGGYARWGMIYNSEQDAIPGYLNSDVIDAIENDPFDIPDVDNVSELLFDSDGNRINLTDIQTGDLGDAPTADQITFLQNAVQAQRAALNNAQTEADREAAAEQLETFEQALADALGTPAVADATDITSRLRLIVTATAESDAGLSFGAQTRLQLDDQEHTYDGGGGGFNPARFWVSYEGLEVSAGHVQGAFEFMPGIYDGSVGLTGLSYANVVYNYGADAYSSGGAGRQGIDVKYAMGDLSAHLSYSTDETGGAFNDASDRLAAFLAYTVNGWTLAGAFQDVNDEQDEMYSNWAFTANGDLGVADVTVQVASNDYSNVVSELDIFDDNELKYGVAADFEVGAATTVTAFANHDQSRDLGDGGNNFGVGVNHDLGGGASIRGGVASLSRLGDDETQTVADLGVQFNF